MRNCDSRKRILVTGGAVFLAPHLRERLLKLDHDVLCLDNLLSAAKRKIDHLQRNPRFEFLRQDITFSSYVEVDEVYNLACPALSIHYQHDPVQTNRTSVIGAANMLDLAKRLRIRILQTSTSEVYEDLQMYDRGKRCAETLFFDYHRQHNLDIKVAHLQYIRPTRAPK